MPVIRLETIMHAPIQICFDVSRSIDLHMESTAQTKERAVDGVTSGLIGLRETVTWEAVHFGIRQRLTAKITAYEEPRFFVDEMVTGAFKRFRHEHEFIAVDENTTRVLDTFDYTSPFGVLGKFVDWLVLESYMKRFLLQRNEFLKKAAESQAKLQ